MKISNRLNNVIKLSNSIEDEEEFKNVKHELGPVNIDNRIFYDRNISPFHQPHTQ